MYFDFRMIDLSAETHAVPQHLQECLVDVTARSGRPALLLYHTHPNYGQVHIYFSDNVDAQPYDDLIGTPIQYVLDFDGWSPSDDWAQGEDHFQPVLKLADGEIVKTKDHEEFNVRWAEHLDMLLKSTMKAMSDQLRPTRVIVQSENAEYVSDWRTDV